jgi:predicted nucleic acid-binding protein
MECEAILSIIDVCDTGHWMFFSSDILYDEILAMTDMDKREKVLLLYASAGSHIDLTEEIAARANELSRLGIKSYDALHIASAESAGADVFLTTDRRLINAARRLNVTMLVQNPLIWITEVLYDREPEYDSE